SILFADGESKLDAGEDLDLTTPFLTDKVTSRDDLLPIGELQVGLEWQPPATRYAMQPFVRAALEGQIWSGAGNATSEDGNLGLLGFHVGIGFLR
ncbi:MAG: hypothetical protein KDB23_07010, partial [Planctomycetales bacterium]|nr:hypothetical protein [Planctomycetales bacterium]